MHECAIGDLPGIPRHERRRIDGDMPAEMLLQAGLRLQGLRQVHHPDVAADCC